MKSVTIEVPEDHLRSAKVELEKHTNSTMTDEQVVSSLFFTGFNTLFESAPPIYAGPSSLENDDG